MAANGRLFSHSRIGRQPHRAARTPSSRIERTCAPAQGTATRAQHIIVKQIKAKKRRLLCLQMCRSFGAITKGSATATGAGSPTGTQGLRRRANAMFCANRKSKIAANILKVKKAVWIFRRPFIKPGRLNQAVGLRNLLLDGFGNNKAVPRSVGFGERGVLPSGRHCL